MQIAILRAVLSLALIPIPLTSLAAPLAPPIEEVRKQLKAGDVEAAVDASEVAVESHADDAQAWLWAGRAYGRQAMEASMLTKAKWAGRTRDAWEKAVELEPDLLEARLDLIQYYLSAPGFLGGGRDVAEAQVLEIQKRSPSMGKHAEGMLARADEDLPKAEALFREALAMDSENTRARSAISALLQAGERMDEVRTLWQERLQAKPDDAMAVYQLGRWSAITGKDLEQGLAHMDAFIATGVIPEDLSLPAAHWRRGQLLEKLGRLDDAIAAYEIAAGDASMAEQVEADLERVREARG